MSEVSDKEAKFPPMTPPVYSYTGPWMSPPHASARPYLPGAARADALRPELAPFKDASKGVAAAGLPLQQPMYMRYDPQVYAAAAPLQQPIQQHMPPHQHQHQHQHQQHQQHQGGPQPQQPSPQISTLPIAIPGRSPTEPASALSPGTQNRLAPQRSPIVPASPPQSAFSMSYPTTFASSYPPGSSYPYALDNAYVPVHPKGRTMPLGRRMKVSRACDECRRKKTRCDFDATKEMCSPCRRAATACTFERVQLKRGPARRRASSQSQAAASPSQDDAKAASPQTKHRSSLPLLVEIACRQSKSPEADRGRLDDSRVAALKVDDAKVSALKVDDSTASAVDGLPAVKDEARDGPGAKPEGSTSESARSSESAVESADEMKVEELDARPAKCVPIDVFARKPVKLEPLVLPQSVASPSPTPPPFDDGVHGISHNALMTYYTFVHPTFPLLPDLVSDFDEMLGSAGPAKQHLVAALNGDDSQVPLGIGNLTPSPTMREAHFIALMLMYMKTLDVVWLGAGVATCTELLSDPHCARSGQLATVLVELDCLHSAIFDLRSLLPPFVADAALKCDRTRAIMRTMLQTPEKEHFVGAPETVLRTCVLLNAHKIKRDEAKAKLVALLPQLYSTPLQTFVKHMV